MLLIRILQCGPAQWRSLTDAGPQSRQIVAVLVLDNAPQTQHVKHQWCPHHTHVPPAIHSLTYVLVWVIWRAMGHSSTLLKFVLVVACFHSSHWWQYYTCTAWWCCLWQWHSCMCMWWWLQLRRWINVSTYMVKIRQTYVSAQQETYVGQLAR